VEPVRLLGALLVPTKSHKDKPILMLIGGQQGDYREAQCVPREWALKVAREYFDHGRRADGLTWMLG
jgi:immunity protein Imm1 of predicted polymorphic toxin system